MGGNLDSVGYSVISSVLGLVYVQYKLSQLGMVFDNRTSEIAVASELIHFVRCLIAWCVRPG